MPCYGVLCIFLTTPLSYAAVAFYFGRYEKLLRYGKLATSQIAYRIQSHRAPSPLGCPDTLPDARMSLEVGCHNVCLKQGAIHRSSWRPQRLQRIRYDGVPAPKTLAPVQGGMQAARAQVEGAVQGARTILARRPARPRDEQSTGREPWRCPPSGVI
jgi:hypothetical protein